MKIKYLIEVIDLEIWISRGNIIIINLYVKIKPRLSSFYEKRKIKPRLVDLQYMFFLMVIYIYIYIYRKRNFTNTLKGRSKTSTHDH